MSNNLILSPRRYISQINGKSFQDCINFINEQASELGVPVSNSYDLGSLIYSWAQYLTTQSKSSESIFKSALAIVDVKDPKTMHGKLKVLHKTLSGKLGFLDKLLHSQNELANMIVSHPFYEIFQKETLDSGFSYVQQVYDEFKKVDATLGRVKDKLGSLESKLTSLSEPDMNLTNFHTPTDMSSNLNVATSIAETRRLMEVKPDLFYSSIATGALADAAAKELYLIWRQSFMTYDLAASRWLCIAYFGLLMNAAVSSSVSAKVFAGMLEANNAQMRQFNNLLSSISR